MAFTVGVFTSDPNLLRCELARLGAEIPLGDAANEPMGAGWFADDNVLLQRYSAAVRPAALELLGGVLESDALLVHAAPLSLGMSIEENTQPYRYRQWLFAAQGTVGGTEKLRARVVDALPEHLIRVVKGALQQELAFALFLSALRDTGRTDDQSLDAKTVASVLGTAARALEQAVLEAGGKQPSLALFATNNHALAAARLGEQPLFFRLLEGSPQCSVCALDGSSESQALLRAHLRRKTVVASTAVKDPHGWMALQPGEAVGVGRSLNVERVRF